MLQEEDERKSDGGGVYPSNLGGIPISNFAARGPQHPPVFAIGPLPLLSITGLRHIRGSADLFR
jgi:hypothetical protein